MTMSSGRKLAFVASFMGHSLTSFAKRERQSDRKSHPFKFLSFGCALQLVSNEHHCVHHQSPETPLALARLTTEAN